jgi:acetyltransferase-like isoleucine patch superfamily enzyme
MNIHSMIGKIFGRLIGSLPAMCGPEFYATISAALDKAAVASFRAQVLQSGLDASVRHPIYLKNPKYFQIGTGFGAGPGLRLEAWDEYAGERFSPIIKIGNNVCMNWNVHIGAINRIEIHDNVLIGSHVLITDHSHGTTSAIDLALTPIQRPLMSKGSVVIEESVWIGEGVCILAGVTIGKGAIIGANAVVTSDVAPGAVVGGIPARQLKPALATH